MKELRPFIVMQPALEAREAMMAATVTAYGTANMKRGQAHGLWALWKRLSDAPGRRRRRVQAYQETPQETAARLAGMGMQVEIRTK